MANKEAKEAAKSLDVRFLTASSARNPIEFQYIGMDGPSPPKLYPTDPALSPEHKGTGAAVQKSFRGKKQVGDNWKQLESPPPAPNRIRHMYGREQDMRVRKLGEQN